MVENSNTSYENEIDRANSSSNEDFRIIVFPREVLISEEGQLKNLGKWPKTGKSAVMQIRVYAISVEITSSTPWYQNLCIGLIFLHVRPSSRGKFLSKIFSFL